MPVSYTYALYPFTWNATTKCHEPPAGSACVIDLRPLPEQAKLSQSSGWGFFAWPGTVPPDAVVITTGYAPEAVVDTAARVECRTKLGLSANPGGTTLAEMMADVLGSLADPTGASMAKPIMPTSDGTLELHLSGHSRVWSAKVDAADVLSASPKGRHNRIRDVIRADLDEAERVGGAALMGKVLGAKLLALGVDREEIKAGASGKKAQWERLLSAAVKSKHGANARPRDPETTLSESWPTSGAISSGQDLPWVAYGAGNWQNANLQVVTGAVQTTVVTGIQSHGRCTTALSSADHYAECLVTVTTNYGGGPTSRCGAGAETCYVADIYVGGSQYRLYKWVAGASTVLSTGARSGNASAVLTRMSSSGSTQTASVAGLSDLVVTDTSITGNLFGGISATAFTTASQVRIGAWTASDGLSGGGARHRSKMTLLGSL